MPQILYKNLIVFWSVLESLVQDFSNRKTVTQKFPKIPDIWSRDGIPGLQLIDNLVPDKSLGSKANLFSFWKWL